MEILRFADGNAAERIALSGSHANPHMLPLPGDRLLLSSRVAGRQRLVTMARGQEAVPFLLSREESRGPLAKLGEDRVLCRVGSGADASVAVASVSGGRVLQWVKSIPAGDNLRSLAGSPDGKTIYYVASGGVWSVPADGGSAPNRIRDGDGIAPDPRGEYLLVQVNDPEGTRLVRVPLSGGPETILPTQYPLVYIPMSPGAIGLDGRVVLQVAPPDSWYWPAAVLDPKTGKMEIVPDDQADMNAQGWDDQGRVVVAAQLLRSSLWRFRPE